MINTRTLLGMGLTLALGACASTPRTNGALESARAAVGTAEIDPNVNKYAALDLAAARKYLSAAEAADRSHDDAMVGQESYLATQTARLAQAHGAQKSDEALVANGQVERDRIELNARTRQLANARAATANAQVAAANAQATAADAQTAAANAKMATADANANAMDANMQTAAALQLRDQAAQQRDQATQQRDQAADQAARLQTELDALKATPTPRGLVLTLGDVLFDTGKSELKPGATRTMDQLAQFLNEHADRRVQIDGFTDSIGSDSYNQELSQRRADAVKAALMARDVAGSRIGTKGYGKEYPVATNSDSGGRKLNRRIDVVIGATGGSTIAPRS